MDQGLPLLGEDKPLTIKTALRSSVAKNALSLYIIQFANYILPLITVPYLVRVLRPDGYGVVAFGQSSIGYFIILVDYGFALSATRKISVERNDLIAVSRTVFSVWGAKLLLCIAGFGVLLLLVTVVPKLHEFSMLLLILYGLAIGNVFFPIWLFQGMEKMVLISVINLAMRLAVVIGIFTIINRPEDYLLYAGVISLGSIGVGLIGAGVALFMFKLRPVFPSWQEIRKAFVEGRMVFLSKASVSFYTVGNAFILGMLTNNTVVGYYSAAEKIVRAMLGLLVPISQAAYPRFSKMASESKARALQWGRSMLILMSTLGLALSIALFIGAPLIVRIVLSSGYEPSVGVMRILAILPLLIGTNNVLGIQIMLPFGKDKALTSILLVAGLLNITLAFLFVPLWQERGMAVGVVLTEMFVTAAMLLYVVRVGLSPLTLLASRLDKT